MPTNRRRWTRDELLLALNVYCRTPFGKIHSRNAEIIALSKTMGRTPSAVAMKLLNFASLDPIHHARQVRGLSNAGKEDLHIWQEFNDNWEQLAFESQLAMLRVRRESSTAEGEYSEMPSLGVATDRESTVRVRLVQRFFRDAVLSSYDYTCAMCQLRLPQMLTASHIIPWSKNIARRADPKNGLALCAFHDRAFDRGLVALDDDRRILVSAKVRIRTTSRLHQVGFLDIEGTKALTPARFAPAMDAITYHRKEIFLQ